MSAWHVSTSAFDQVDRGQVWQQALTRIHLPSANRVMLDNAFHGDVASLVSPQGIEFSRMVASPQTISGRSGDQPYSVWLSVLMEGRCNFTGNHGEPADLQPGDIIYGPTGEDATLTLESEFRMLYVKIPRLMLHPRLVNMGAMRAGKLSRNHAINRILAGMLEDVAEEMDELDPSELRPIELALTEFILVSLTERSAIQAFGSTGKLIHYQAICQSIEDQLGDPALTVGKIAAQQNASLRYIQKLFEAAGQNFRQYLRQRRLERCRSELQSPLYRHLSVTDICLRWGFNDPAHFSRSFRAEFNTTPRAYRQKHLGAAAGDMAECGID